MSEYGLTFSAPRIVMTRFGERSVSDAPATEAFWTAWRSQKDALKERGYSVGKNGNGMWKVSLWEKTSTKEERVEALAASKATDAVIDIPTPAGMTPYPFQRAGAQYALARPATLIADEMGLGKTIQAITVANATKPRRILVVCPASLKINWSREIGAWQTLGLPVKIISAGKKAKVEDGWTIINYDILSRYPQLKDIEWDLLVLDECHRLKNTKAQRTKFLLGAKETAKTEAIPPVRAKRKLLLTGTPICNRPIELYTLLNYIDPARWGNFMGYAKRYCAAFHNGYGWNFSGASNLEELQARLRETCMVRRLKSEVLTELPAKQRQIITLEPDASVRALVAREVEAHRQHEEAAADARTAMLRAEAEDNEEAYANAVAALQEAEEAAFSELSRLRHEVALAKVPAALEYLNELNEDHKIVVFAHHKDVVTALHAELDWVPGNMSQAEDRCHRIGQRDSVLVQHLVFDGSLDVRMANILVSKQTVIDKALDKPVEAIDYDEFVPRPSGPRKEPPKLKPLPAVTPAQIAATHTALRILSGFDPDGALHKNDIGFNRMDSEFGHGLANQDTLTPRQAAIGMRMARKYHRQYSAELYTAMFGKPREE